MFHTISSKVSTHDVKCREERKRHRDDEAEHERAEEEKDARDAKCAGHGGGKEERKEGYRV